MELPSDCNSESSWRWDDAFSSSSRETVVDSSCPSDTSAVLQALLGAYTPSLHYCFFCTNSFHEAAALTSHVKKEHTADLQRLSRNKLDILCFHSCPFCSAHFYAKSLLPQHLLQDHCDQFSQLFRRRAADEYVQCPFCDYRVLAVFENLLAHHVDEAHMAELEDYLSANHSVRVESNAFVKSFVDNVPDLIRSQDGVDHTNRRPTGRGTWMGEQDRKTVKLPEKTTPKKTSCWLFSKKHVTSEPQKHPEVNPQFVTSTPLGVAAQQKAKFPAGDYRCGSCHIFFPTNADLVGHVRSRHNAVKGLLHPLFGCGECQATFFKNSFVKRHRRYHHTFIEN